MLIYMYFCETNQSIILKQTETINVEEIKKNTDERNQKPL
jgi:hypothetical protein